MGKFMLYRIISTLAILSLLLTTIPSEVIAKTKPTEYVRTANYFLMSGPVLDQSIDELSKYDLLVIPVEAQVYNKTFFTEIHKKNPDIVILAYVATVSWNDLYWTDPMHQNMYTQIQSSWWLKDGNGNQVSIWPGTRALNLNSGWVPFLSKYVQTDVMSTGLWDGIFYDEVQDSSVSADAYKQLFQLTRQNLGEGAVVITNGSSNPVFSPFVNGRMFETFPSSKNSLREWKNQTAQYLSLEKTLGTDPIEVINVNSENTGIQNDYGRVRFGLTTTLLGDGYFSYDFGTQNHSQLWSYDEYGTFLGAPKTTLTNVFNPQQTSVDIGVWQREFAQGKVIVNATDQKVTIDLQGDFEKIHGSQDPIVNDGSIVSDVDIPAKDGVILLRPIQEIVDATFLNGAFARVFSDDGKQKRTGFFAYDSTQRGGMQIIHMTDHHQTSPPPDPLPGRRGVTIVADNTNVSVYNADGTLRTTFAPYTKNYNKGINIAVGDLDQDGSMEIVTGTDNGGGPQVRIFNTDGKLVNSGFFAYGKNFRGGVSVAVGDLNGDGKKEIICGAGFGGGPQVRVFNKDGKLINPGFFAYDKRFRGGVNVAVADVDGDKIDEIVTGPGIGGSPLARIFNQNGKKKSEFYVFDAGENHGLEIVATDVDGDGRAEIIGLTSNVFTLSSFKE